MNAAQFSSALGKVNDKYIMEAITYERKKKSGWLKWGAIAACFALILAIGIPQLTNLLPFTNETPQGMYKIGKVWEEEQFTFCVLNAAFCSDYQTETGETIIPDTGCRFIAVEYCAVYAEDVTLLDCTIQKSDVYSEPHGLYIPPIQLTSDSSQGGGKYMFLFSIPLSESDADTTDSYTLSVSIDVSNRTHLQDFSLASAQGEPFLDKGTPPAEYPDTLIIPGFDLDEPGEPTTP